MQATAIRANDRAQNLYERVFKNDPNARLVVNAGFAHIQKTGKYLGGTSMGEFFQKISGIDPLTIEQTMMIQHARADQNHPYYIALTQAQHLREPSVFVDAGGKTWTLKPDEYDMSVIFPPQEASTDRRNGCASAACACHTVSAAKPATTSIRA